MRVRLAVAAAPSGLDGSEDFDFLDLTFFGAVPSEARRLGIIHGPSMGLVVPEPS